MANPGQFLHASCGSKIEKGFDARVSNSKEGREGVKWELGFAFFRGWEMGFCALGLGFMKKKQ